MPFNLDEENFYPRFIMEFYKTLRLDRYSEDNCLFITFDINGHEFNISLDQFAELTSLPNQGICLYSDASLDQLEPNLEQVPPYNSNLPSLEDIRYRIQQKLVIRENVYVAIGNRDHVQASIAFTLYFLEVGMQYNLECFMNRSYSRALLAHANMSNEQRETRGRGLTNLYKTIKEGMSLMASDQ
ncbi:hypothetical protein Tco_1313660 [Tanacetum coccineum]